MMPKTLQKTECQFFEKVALRVTDKVTRAIRPCGHAQAMDFYENSNERSDYYVEAILGAHYVVIDVDGSRADAEQQKGLTHVVKRLEAVAQACGAPIVQSKSGGPLDRHFYFKKNARTVLKSKLQPHCEIKTGNVRITLPTKGSKYTILAGTLCGDIPLMPLELLEWCKGKKSTVLNFPSYKKEITTLTLKEKLGVLNVKDYGKGNYEEWVKLLYSVARSKEGTSEERLSVFLDWCREDSDYPAEAHAKKIQAAWKSASIGIGAIGEAFLDLKVAQAKGGHFVDPQLTTYTRDDVAELLQRCFPRTVYYELMAGAFCETETENVWNPELLAIEYAQTFKHRFNLTKDIPLTLMVETMKWFYKRYNSRHALQERARRVVWDGEDRVNTFVERYITTEDEKSYVQAIFTLFLKALIHRTFNPSARFEYAPVFWGPQGGGKSSIGVTLAGLRYYVANWRYRDKDSAMLLNTNLLVEIAEFDHLTLKQSELLKEILTNRSDQYRRPYADANGWYARMGIIYGTSNTQEIIEDMTGSRRYLVCSVVDFDEECCKKECDQIWAQLLQMYLEDPSDAQLQFDTRTHAKTLAKINFIARREDTWVEVFRKALQDEASDIYIALANYHYLTKEAVREWFTLQGFAETLRWDRRTDTRVTHVMAALKFNIASRQNEMGQWIKVWVPAQERDYKINIESKETDVDKQFEQFTTPVQGYADERQLSVEEVALLTPENT